MNLKYTSVFLFCFCSLWLTCAPEKKGIHSPESSSDPKEIQLDAMGFEEEKYGLLVWNGSGFVEMELDEEPKYKDGGKDGFLANIYTVLRYPPYAAEYKIQGTVWITIVINEWGEMEAIGMEEGIGGGCDEASLEVVRKAALKGFKPAIKNGKARKVKFGIPVRFRL